MMRVVSQEYRKKPVVITASQWFKNGDHPEDAAMEMFDYPNGQRPQVIREGAVVRYYRHPQIDGASLCEQCQKPHHEHGWIDTLEQGHRVCPADWIITGVKGERYPCKPDIFQATYEPADAPAAQPVAWIEYGKDGHPLGATLQKPDGYWRCEPLFAAAAPAASGDELVARSEWIAVSERLPEVGVKVWTWPESPLQVRWIKDGGNWFFDAMPVTHWQPLPKAPNLIDSPPRPNES